MGATPHETAPREADDDLTRTAEAVRRFVLSRTGPRDDVEDIVQEAIARTLAAGARVAEGMTEAYAVTTARNLIASAWRAEDVFRRHRWRLLDPTTGEDPDDVLVDASERDALERALRSLPSADRDLLVAHQVEGAAVKELGRQLGISPASVATKLHRARAQLRVAYLIEAERTPPPTNRCRIALTALSLRDRRRQRESGAHDHVRACSYCARLSASLADHADPAVTSVRVASAPDIVLARQTAREQAAAVGLSGVDLTMIATAVSEAARNVLRFAGSGEILVARLEEDGRRGVRVTARDSGPGIPDVEAAMRDGFSTNRSLGLGLPGIRRLMDDFDLTTSVGAGTTVTFTKWESGGRR